MDDLRFEAKYPKESRFEEIEKILKFIKEGKSVQMIGLPGVGRSNLFGLLSYNRNVRIAHLGEDEQTKMHFVDINFSELRNKPLTDVNKFMFLSLVDSLRERDIIEDYNKIDQIFKESVASNDELLIFQGLKKTIDYLALEKDLTVVFLFDRFQTYTSSITPAFFANLRSLRDRAKYKFSVVFSLSRSLSEVFEAEIMEDFLEFVAGNEVYLSIEDKSGLDFRIKHLEENLGTEFNKELVSEVEKLTYGHGKLTRICLEQYESINPTDNLEEFLISNVRVREVLQEIWRIFTPEERDILGDIAGESEIPQYLLNIQIVKDRKISIPLFKDYLEIKNEEMQNQPLIYDEEKNEIKKGELVFSNGLTKLEFKLIKFLMKNPGKVLSKDEIVAEVWGDLGSTQGVTDQAIDQLVFRLRKKIEEDPESPKYIQTIKGRGLKFD